MQPGMQFWASESPALSMIFVVLPVIFCGFSLLIIPQRLNRIQPHMIWMVRWAFVLYFIGLVFGVFGFVSPMLVPQLVPGDAFVFGWQSAGIAIASLPLLGSVISGLALVLFAFFTVVALIRYNGLTRRWWRQPIYVWSVLLTSPMLVILVPMAVGVSCIRFWNFQLGPPPDSPAFLDISDHFLLAYRIGEWLRFCLLVLMTGLASHLICVFSTRAAPVERSVLWIGSAVLAVIATAQIERVVTFGLSIQEINLIALMMLLLLAQPVRRLCLRRRRGRIK